MTNEQYTAGLGNSANRKIDKIKHQLMSNNISRKRTENYIGQLKASLIYKALAIIASFLAVPLMIGHLGREQFSIWSTILSVMSWIVFFDLGLGNGLRNQITIAVAKNDYSEA